MSKAQYFSPKLFRFMRDLDQNNDRAWFRANRERYIEEVRDPVLHFIEDFGPRLGRISRRFVADPSPSGGSMFRIHRDVRFSKDKRPYKTLAAAQFRHERGRSVHAPGFYVHLEPGRVFGAAGLWRPDGPALRGVRQAIEADGARWKRILRGKAFSETLRLDGESLKRAPRGYTEDHPLIEHLKRKDYVVVADFDERAACRPTFLDEFNRVCRTSGPFMRFLTESVGLDW